jgi:hypothetical protein
MLKKILPVIPVASYVLLFWWWASLGYPTETQICNPPGSTENCESHNVLFAFAIAALDKFNFYSALITALATGAIGYFTFTLKRSTDRLWEAGERQLTATQRPWVKVDSITPVSDLVFVHGEGRVDLRVIVSNKGNSPGLRVRVNTKLVASNQISLLQEQAEFSAAHRVSPGPNELRPELTSWPEETITFGVTAWLNSIDMARFRPLADNAPFPITLLAIVGCITYEFSFADGFHQTGLIYDLHRGPSGHAPASPVIGAIPLQGRIPQHELNLRLNFAGTGPVD